jgi:hypothetical protein
MEPHAAYNYWSDNFGVTDRPQLGYAEGWRSRLGILVARDAPLKQIQDRDDTDTTAVTALAADLEADSILENSSAKQTDIVPVAKNTNNTTANISRKPHPRPLPAIERAKSDYSESFYESSAVYVGSAVEEEQKRIKRAARKVEVTSTSIRILLSDLLSYSRLITHLYSTFSPICENYCFLN